MEDQATYVIPEVVKEELVRSRIPIETISDLARLEKGEGLEILKARIAILESVRRASIMLTSPEDWLLFKRPDSRITAYLQDSGCERIRALWGIDIIPTSEPTKATLEEGFAYFIRGDGFCHLTGKEVKAVEGGRGSNEPFCEGKKGALLELAVRKAARANLDGGIVRELAGMGNVPVDELEAVWKGSNKKTIHCAQGRGFAKGERHSEQEAVEQGAPKCPDHPDQIMRLKRGKTGQFWGCPLYPNCKKTLTYKEQVEQPQEPREDSEDPKGPPSLADLKNDLIERVKSLPPNVKAHFMLEIGKIATQDECIVVNDELTNWVNRQKKGEPNA